MEEAAEAAELVKKAPARKKAAKEAEADTTQTEAPLETKSARKAPAKKSAAKKAPASSQD